ncbi:MAG TPA: Ku protein [Gaiellales bacterium]|jgi:DNA end-binding protein Ku|nr:Ku protein [Gaiellales bacterium]
MPAPNTPRAVWTGSISFGLVNAPVRMYTAVSERDLRFNLLHAPDNGRIGYVKTCKLDGKEVPSEEIVKAYEVSKGEFVPLTDEDFEAARAEGGHSITIHDFVPAEQIDPIYFERTYYLGPEEGPGEAIYALLARAMADSGLAALATYVRSDRENLACLRVRDGVITLERMFFDDEIRSTEGIAPGADAVDERQLGMARDLISAYTADFDPSKYSDTYRERLMEVIDRKRQGKTAKPKAAPKAAEPPDLMAALTASLDAARKSKQGREKPTRSRAKAGSGGRRKSA